MAILVRNHYTTCDLMMHSLNQSFNRSIDQSINQSITILFVTSCCTHLFSSVAGCSGCLEACTNVVNHLITTSWQSSRTFTLVEFTSTPNSGNWSVTKNHNSYIIQRVWWDGAISQRLLFKVIGAAGVMGLSPLWESYQDWLYQPQQHNIRCIHLLRDYNLWAILKFFF